MGGLAYGFVLRILYRGSSMKFISFISFISSNSRYLITVNCVEDHVYETWDEKPV